MIPLTILALVSWATPVWSAPAEALVELALTDQNGDTDRVADHRGEVVLVFVVTARRLRLIKDWEQDLREQLPEMVYLRVADVPADPPATHERVAGKLRRVLPDGVSVMVDLERRWAEGLALETSSPNLLLFDREGRLAARYRGRWHPESVAEVARRAKALSDTP